VATKSRAAAGRTAAQQQYKVLLIAPDSGLENADAEVQRVINALHPEVLIGTVTTTNVLDCVQSNDPFDVVWFLGHSGPSGIQLSDGILSPTHLTQILRPVPPALVVLNSCSSYFIANQLHDDIRCAVICTLISIPDIDAYITGASLARALAQGMDIPDAYAASKPSDSRTYMLLNGNVRLNGQDALDDLRRLVTSTSSDIHQEIGGMTREVATAQRSIQEMRRDMAGVRAEQVRVREELEAGHERYQPRSTGAKAAAWLLGALLMIAAAGLIDFRDALGVPTVAAVLMAAFISLVALWLAVWGLGFRLDKW
jgi:hypothetical protein